MTESELRARCETIVAIANGDAQARRRWVELGLQGPEVSAKQRDRAERYLAGTFPTMIGCTNNRTHPGTGKRSHKELLGSDTNVIAAAEFQEPWHIFCRHCNAEAARAGWG